MLTVTSPDDRVIDSAPVAGCESSMEMKLVGCDGAAIASAYRIVLERDDERAEAAVTVEKQGAAAAATSESGPGASTRPAFASASVSLPASQTGDGPS